MVNNDNEETFEGQTDPSACPDEDRSWKRRQKNDHLTDPKKNLNKDVRLDPAHGNNKRSVRERLGSLDSQGNQTVKGKPRYIQHFEKNCINLPQFLLIVIIAELLHLSFDF